MTKFRCALITSVSLPGHGLRDDLIEFCRNGWVDVGWRIGIDVENVLTRLMKVFSFKGFNTREQLIEQHSYGKNVGPCVNLSALPLLGRHVVRRTKHFAVHGHIGILNFRDTKVHHLDTRAVTNHDVGRLDVAMYQPTAVGVVECIQHLADNFERVPHGNFAPLLEIVVQRPTFGKFHDDDGHTLELDQVIDRNDVGMIEAAQCLCFGVTAFD